ncbi:MAG TPA: VWA domain-containing protein [Thermoanaerobaculia bacterium]|nr:VWA domain-containing protein [Thermoanaerobaculia bacterium]
MRALGIILLAACALSASAQVRESVTVEVVQVPVYVTTSDGKPVTGLTRDAFQLSIDGHPQPIEYFDTFDFASAQAGAPVAAERPRRERRLYLLLFDLTFATPGSIGRAQKAAEQAVVHSNPATDFFSVATYSSTRGVHFLSPFLADRVAVARSIYTLKSSEAQDPLGVALASAERAQWVTTMEQGGAVSGSDDDLSSFLGSEVVDQLKGGQANQDAMAAPRNRLIEFQLEGLGEAAARFGALEGQKHLLVFTEGFDSTRITDIKAKGRPPNLDAHLLDLVKQMHETFVSAGVTLDSIDIKGLRHTFTDLENDALYMLSRGTGGRVIVNRNNLVEAVDTLVQEQRVVYVLGFRQRDRSSGRISVRVSGLPRGAEVSYREGFGYTPRKPALDSLQLADILLNDVPQAGVSLNAGVRTYEGGAEVAVSFARAEVVPQLSDQSPGVDILLYIFDEHGRAVGFKAKRINFSGAGRVNTGYLTLREPFELPAGKYAAKVLLRITGTRSLGFVRRDFAVE